MKRRIRIFAALILLAAITASGIVWNESSYVFPVLMYHSLDHRDKVDKLSVSPESFEAQMKFLHAHEYNVITLEEAIPYIQKKKRVPPKTIAITFDDGFYNNYKFGYPILKKYGIPATMFVITGKVGKKGFFSWDQIREMASSGIITIGSHTVNHLWLPDIPEDKMLFEVRRSKRMLEDKLARPVNTFCYPIGAFDEKVKKAVKDAGYKCAVTTNPQWHKPTDDIYAIKRIKITRTADNLFVFWVETSGFYAWIKERG